ncbi:AraC family transcriptional regulator [Metabacillus sp. HB246100]
MDIQVEFIPNYRIAYMRRVGRYGPENYEVIEKIKNWARDRNLLHSSFILAVPQDNPLTTPSENCRFDGCLVLSEDTLIDESVYEGEISGGPYLIFKVKHTAKDLEKTYVELFPYLKEQGYVLDSKPIFERYVGEAEDESFCEICVPIQGEYQLE